MAKKKDIEYEVAALEKENRDLRATIKSLRKKLKKLTHLELLQTEPEQEEDYMYPPVENISQKLIKSCPKCGAEGIVTVKIAGRQFDKCGAQHCKWRTTATMDGKNGKTEKS